MQYKFVYCIGLCLKSRKSNDFIIELNTYLLAYLQ